MSDRTVVHFIFPSEHIAGCEKRMMVFWIRAKNDHKEYDFRLAVKKNLYNKILKTEEVAAIGNFSDDVSFLDDFGWDGISKLSYVKAIRRYLKKYGRKDIFHFFMYPPFLNPFKKTKTVFTFPANGLNMINSKLGTIFLNAGFIEADLIDILDPIVYERLKKNSIFGKKVYLTKGSFINTDDYLEKKTSEKKNSILLLSRWDWQKQVVTYVSAIPAIHSQLTKEGITDIKFYVIGFGEDEEKINEIIKRPEFQQIEIEARYTPNPLPYLLESKVLLSLQLNTNYPSKGLLEGLAAGCLPVVTDVGTTRLIADPAFSQYVPAKFNDAEIAEAITAVFRDSEEQQDRKRMAARNFVKEHFRYENMAAYYISLYDKLGPEMKGKN